MTRMRQRSFGLFAFSTSSMADIAVKRVRLAELQLKRKKQRHRALRKSTRAALREQCLLRGGRSHLAAERGNRLTKARRLGDRRHRPEGRPGRESRRRM
jgi:hypothetical protein